VKIFVVRHAIAEDRIAFFKKNKKDDLRPLTSKGKKEFKEVSKKLVKLCSKVDVYFASPLMRALQTAEILEKRYKKKFKVVDELRPDRGHADLLSFLKRQKKNSVMIVGHEPFLSEFIGFCVTGRSQSLVDLKKGGLTILDQIPGFKNEFVIKGHFSPKQILRI